MPPAPAPCTARSLMSATVRIQLTSFPVWLNHIRTQTAFASILAEVENRIEFRVKLALMDDIAVTIDM